MYNLVIQACGCPPSCEATGTPPPGGRLLRRCPVGCRRRSPRRVQLLLDSIGSVRSAVGPIASILGMAPGEARARGGATRNNDDVCALCHARTPGDPCRVCGHGSAATTRRRATTAEKKSLFDACKEGRSDVVRAWLNKGAEVDRANTWGETPLFIACQNDHREAARLLLEQGAEVDRADVDGRTPLFAACVKGQVDLARLLLGNGAEVDGPVSEGLYEGQTPLYVACGNGHVDAARLLLDKGAKVNRATRNGNTPLSIAKKNGHSAVVALLEAKAAEESRQRLAAEAQAAERGGGVADGERARPAAPGREPNVTAPSRFVCAQARGGFSGRSGGVAAAVLRAYGAMPDRFGRWKAPRGAGERDLLGICGGIGRFNDHQSIAATPHRSPVLWDMFAHRFPALVS